MSDNGIRIEVKLYKGTEKIFIRKHFENLIKGKSLRTKSLDIDEWVELKKAAQSIDNQLCKLNLTKQSTELTETIESTSLTSHSEEQIRHSPSTPLKVSNHNEPQHCIKMSKDIELQNNYHYKTDEENTKAIAELLAILQENENMFNNH